ncbi:ABC transporter permease [Hamadaea tsunoensis]|uniref:ABC transporter permease n=1 Tax=Hamadaea tsunoensis TaxID=53368 RepID=UPI000412085D|nr:ABC transporter permease [Hamadaea tsunoensis]
MTAVLTAARKAVARRRVQTVIVSLVVLLSSITGVLAIGLLVASHGPFDQAFRAANGAHLTATVSADVAADRLAQTGKATGVTAYAGPFDEVTLPIKAERSPLLGDAVIVGRSEQNGPVDRLALDDGSWLTGPGQIVLSRQYAGPMVSPGETVTVGGVSLKVTGIASSVTSTANAWVWPSQSDVLGKDGHVRQMSYRLAGGAQPLAGLPADTVLSTTDWLVVRHAVNRSISAFVPFIVAFAVLGLILAVLITTNVVNGAVVSGFRTIGILKTLGFTPRQVVAVYVLQVTGPSLIATVIGAGIGVVAAVPLLSDTNRAYDLPQRNLAIPLWVVAVVAVAVPVLVALSAVGPATRAGRLAANQAISVGRAPRSGRGFRLRRALTASPLPRPIALGLGLPLARPSRAVGTVVALLLGSVTLVFSIGLGTSLNRLDTAFNRTDAMQINVDIMVANGRIEVNRPAPGHENEPPPAPKIPDQAAVLAKVKAMTGTAHAVLVREQSLRVAGDTREVNIRGYAESVAQSGFALLSGRLNATPGEVMASTYMLRQTGHHVGDKLTLSTGAVVTIVGEFLDGSNIFNIVGDMSLVTEPDRAGIEIGLAPGTDAARYAEDLQKQYDAGDGVFVDNLLANSGSETLLVLTGLITLLTLLLSGVAAAGVLNTVVLTTRERIQEIGVLKSLGMTPRQTRMMIISSMIGLGLLAGVVAVPLGVALQHRVLPIMGNAAGIAIPSEIVDVYGLPQLVLLGLAGVVLAVLGALLPAGWAARTRVATALRAE